MKIKQIGNGGAFNYKETNSSFLIENNRKYLLFDCGHSVYQKLRELEEASEISLKDLKAVYISHFDDDHIGSLKTLIYYQYFINNIIMDIINADVVYFSHTKALAPRIAASASSSSLKTSFTLFLKIGKRFRSM